MTTRALPVLREPVAVGAISALDDRFLCEVFSAVRSARESDERHVARLHTPSVNGYLTVTGGRGAEAIVNVLRALSTPPREGSR